MITNTVKIPIRSVTTCVKEIRKFEEMPGPRPLPFIGNLWRYLPYIGHYSFEKLQKTYGEMYEQYGPVVREKIFGDRIIVHLFDPQDMRKVYDSAGYRPWRISHRALEKYRRARPELYSGPGLFPSNGEEWFRFRQLFQKILLSTPVVEGCTSPLEEVTDDFISKIPSHLDENKEIDLQPMLFSFALECIGVVTLNRRLGCLSAEGNKEATSLIKAASDTHSAVYDTENMPYSIRSYKKLESAQNLLSNVVTKYLEEAIEEYNAGRNTASLVGKMLQIEKADKKDVFTMILDMFMAGIDTTAFTLSFALYNLARNKEAQKKLRAELMEHLPTKDSKLSGNKSSFPYLKAVVNETLRVNPISIGTGRILNTDLVLGGYSVPPKTMVILQHQIASMQEQHFPNPNKFEPERWIRKEFPPLVSSPFGYGARMCVGKKLALRELHLALAKIIRNFEVDYFYEDIEPLNRLINVPDKPLKIRLERTKQ